MADDRLEAMWEQYRDRWEATAPRARQTEWLAEDGWYVIYTTSKVQGGEHDGRYLTMAYKPVGQGARGGRATAQEWERVYLRAFTTRKAAKARAVALWRQHSPKWNAAHPEVDHG